MYDCETKLHPCLSRLARTKKDHISGRVAALELLALSE